MSKNWCLLHIRNGEIQNKSQVKKLFDQLRDGKWMIEIAQANKRSDQQNRYYFGVVVPLIQNAFNERGIDASKQEIHDTLKGKFNYVEVVNEETGEYTQIAKSTTGLNKEQFSQYLEKIQIWSAQFLNLVIPDPGVQLTVDYADND